METRQLGQCNAITSTLHQNNGQSKNAEVVGNTLTEYCHGPGISKLYGNGKY